MNEFIREIEDILSKVSDEAKAEAEFLVELLGNKTKTEILLGEKIDNKEYIKEIALKRAKVKAPLQYLANETIFMGERFFVNENVLIPRDETEILVQETVKTAEKVKGHVGILEIGIGSGAISCMVSKMLMNKDVQILGVDISVSALEVALQNIERHISANRLIIRKSDIFSSIYKDEKFDIIFSNPPYIPYGTELQDEVKFEPPLALFAEDDGLYFYKKIIKEGKNFLKANGFMLFELGINQAQKVKEEFIKNGYNNIAIIKDLAGIERVIKAQIK